MLPGDQHFLGVVIHDVQRPSASATIGCYSDLEILQIQLNGDLGIDILLSSQSEQRVTELGRLLVHSDPTAIQEDLRAALDMLGRTLHQILNAELLQKILDEGLSRAEGDVAHERDVLHQSDSLSLRCLGRTHEAPMCVMELPRFHQLTGSREGGNHSPQMGQRSHKGQAIQTLRDTSSHRFSRLILAPISSGELILHARTKCGDLAQNLSDLELFSSVEGPLEGLSEVHD
mmetsp:Transcript_35375/g.75415  ORF Transcript_35375/g.75415 Transcript_35375/m.75415 type:complete len:231 (-) Transcript_35375:1465-2157(-)